MVKINIKSSTDNKFDVDVETGITVADFKNVIASKCSIPANQQRIIYSGRILKDHQTLDELKIQDGHTVHLVKGAAPPPPPPVEQQVPTTSNTTPQGIPGVPQNINEMMSNPMFQEVMNSRVMDSFFDNPEIFREMMMDNPEMREIMNNNPEMAHILNDPRQLRQSLEMMRNPELMREMMRNADRAMINIENHPEGFNLLRRMYTDVQEPLMNAANQQAMSQNATNSNPIQTNTDPNPNSQPLPNPWSTTPSNNPTTPTTNPTSPTRNQGTTGTTPSSNTGASNPFASMFGGGMGGNTGNNSNPFASMLGGGGMGGMEGMLNGMDPQQIQQMMQNPAIQQYMQRIMSNPQMMQQMLNMNPQARAMMDQNPQLREMMQNPEFLNMMTNPENMNAMMQLQQAMGTLQNNGVFPQGGMSGMSGMGGMGGMGGMDFSSMFGGMGGMGGMGGNRTQQPPVNQEPPEVRFRLQLEQLEELGFIDRAANIQALTSTNGNINMAIDRLLR